MAHVTHPCSTCGVPYRGDSRSRHCSPECRAEAGRRRAAAWYAERKDDPALKTRVAEATQRHYEKVKADAEAWSTRLARTAEWRAENPDKLRAQNRAWVDANRGRKHAKDHRRRARLLDAFVEDVDPQVVWTRDRGICGICSETIDPALVWPDKRARTIDHVIPLARGGTHEYANVQLAHMVCNARKNDRV